MTAVFGVQLQDISAWGNGTEVAQLLLPGGTRLSSFEKVSIPRPPKDTRTVRGIVEQPPLCIYRCAPRHAPAHTRVPPRQRSGGDSDLASHTRGPPRRRDGHTRPATSPDRGPCGASVHPTAMLCPAAATHSGSATPAALPPP